MPSGLTEKIYNGEDMSLRNFALKCAKKFGFGYYASNYGESDLPKDKMPIHKPKDYTEELNNAKQKVKYYESLKSDNTYLDEYRKVCDERIREYEGYNRKDAELRQRYNDMIDKVNNWKVDESLGFLKDYMLSQLNESLEFDCGHIWKLEQSNNFETDALEWVDKTIEFWKNKIEDVIEEQKKENEYVENCNKFLKCLYSSLDKVEPLK